MGFKAGLGYDAHTLDAGAALVLGGVRVPYARGLVGHSDADVLTHAIIDSLLGAAGLGDIGRRFPDTDESYRGISSLILLKKTAALIRRAGYRIGNIDAVIIAERPKLAPFIPEMEANVAKALKIKKRRVNVKATTEEGLGFTGDGSGMSAKAVCVIKKA